MDGDWTDRVDQLTAGSLYEQLRTVVAEARDLLNKFNANALEQGGLVLDAQRELESTFSERIAKVGEEMAASIAKVREEMAEALASMQQAHARSEERAAATDATMDERLSAMTARIESLSGIEERAAARMVDLLASAFARLRDEQSGSEPTAAETTEAGSVSPTA